MTQIVTPFMAARLWATTTKGDEVALLRRFFKGMAVAVSGLLAMSFVATAGATALASPAATAHRYAQLHTGIGLCVNTNGAYHVGTGLIEQYCDYASPTQWHLQYNNHGEVQIQLLKDQSLCVARLGNTLRAGLAYCSRWTWMRYTRLVGYYMRLRSTDGAWFTYPYKPTGNNDAGYPIGWSVHRSKYDADWNVPTLP